jgi:hypothetical protein
MLFITLGRPLVQVGGVPLLPTFRGSAPRAPKSTAAHDNSAPGVQVFNSELNRMELVEASGGIVAVFSALVKHENVRFSVCCVIRVT